MNNLIEIYFDGACGPVNPGGRCGGGAVIYLNRKVIKEIAEEYHPSEPLQTSNNVGEYYGLLKALEYLVEKGLQDRKIEVKGDSKLVIKQMKNVWRIKQGIYLEIAIKTKKLVVKEFFNIKFKWLPRLHNTYADKLSKKAIEASQ